MRLLAYFVIGLAMTGVGTWRQQYDLMVAGLSIMGIIVGKAFVAPDNHDEEIVTTTRRLPAKRGRKPVKYTSPEYGQFLEGEIDVEEFERLIGYKGTFSLTPPDKAGTVGAIEQGGTA